MFKKEQVTGFQEYLDVLSTEQVRLCLEHCREYNLPPMIRAWYMDMDDFLEDWINGIGYTYQEATEILKVGKQSGEFKQFEDGSLVRFQEQD